ncbi:ABC transporter ATP-binding protein [Planobispora takensis]|uniref:ABC transporter ATP-binding protein n=1 Tax=Planobispora takensis TaxID=1367882 RepID=A0A8J3SY98_9ACTN|nr:ABC transporter ATP-binding protein [Planobispora takensis]GII01452.1 ABC transporter ATP-binding protein [Planobispora takensis]
MVWSLTHAVSDRDRLDRAAAGRVVRRTLGMIRPYRWTAAAAVAVLVAGTSASLTGPWILREAVDRGLGEPGVLAGAVLAFLGAAAATLLLSRAQILLVGRVGERFLRDLRERVFTHLLRMPAAFFDRNPTGVLVSRMTSDIDALQDLVQLGLAQLVQNLLTLGLLAVVLTLLSWKLALVCLVLAPLVAWATIRFKRRSGRAYLAVRDETAATMSALQEGVTGVRITQAFGQGERRLAAFLDGNRRLLRANVTAVRVQAEYLPVLEFAGAAATALVLGAGGLMVAGGELSLGTMTAFVLYLLGVFEPVQQLSYLFNTAQASAAALGKLYGLLDTEPERRYGTADRSTPDRPAELPPGGELRLDRVAFGYPGAAAPVLDGVSLRVPPGERLALVGPTGAGKSTLAKLAAGLYDPDGGTVTYAGADLREVSREALRRRVVLVPQEGHLFQGTVLENIRFARPGASESEVRAALDLIGATGRFDPHAEVGERGALLSAGERQLVALARAALVDADVLMLDEATSSVDPGTESRITEAMDRLTEGRTVIVIAHRLSTVERSDRIAVVEDGGIAELGTHDELITRGGRYAALHAAWEVAR